jgi:hypothetical protein
MLIVNAILISFLLLYVYLFCIVRLVNHEFKHYIEFLRDLNKKWLFILGLSILLIFAPLIFIITVVTVILWKITNFLLK